MLLGSFLSTNLVYTGNGEEESGIHDMQVIKNFIVLFFIVIVTHASTVAETNARCKMQVIIIKVI